MLLHETVKGSGPYLSCRDIYRFFSWIFLLINHWILMINYKLCSITLIQKYTLRLYTVVPKQYAITTMEHKSQKTTFTYHFLCNKITNTQWITHILSSNWRPLRLTRTTSLYCETFFYIVRLNSIHFITWNNREWSLLPSLGSTLYHLQQTIVQFFLMKLQLNEYCNAWRMDVIPNS